MQDPFFEKINNIDSGTIVTSGDIPEKAFLVSGMFTRSRSSLVVVLENQKNAVQFMDALHFFLPDRKSDIIFFPGYHILPFKNLSFHRQTSIDRLAALSKMLDRGENPALIVTFAETLVQKLIPKSSLNQFAEIVMAGEETDRDALVRQLEAGGYLRSALVEDPGDYSVRGDLLDLFAPGNRQPVRIEFFGDLVESIRFFSPFSQRGTKETQEVILLPASEAVIQEEAVPHILARLRTAGQAAGLPSEKIRAYVNEIRENGRFSGIEGMLPIVYEHLDTFFDYLPEQVRFVLDGPEILTSAIEDFKVRAVANYQNTVSEGRLCVAPEKIYLEWETAEKQMSRFGQISLQPFSMIAAEKGAGLPGISFPGTGNEELSGALRSQGSGETPLQPLVRWIEQQQAQARRVWCILSSDAQANRLLSLLKPYGIVPLHQEHFSSSMAKGGAVFYTIGDLPSGFVYENQALAIVTENEIFGKKRIRRRTSRRDLKAEFIAPEELKNGDIVVHVEHGVGRYEGLCSLSVGGITQDFILIFYQDDDKLYLPVDRIEMIGKYVGVDGYQPVLDKIGSKAWAKSKAKAKQEVEKMAADLLDLYAKRKVNKGFAFSRPDHYYQDFEAAFAYEETRDQLRAIDDVHLDMESDVPMDRLVCGDVGYGKTEVAIRAAFKAVNDGKQVAVVVPTTILAEQHLATFTERFRRYPVEVACLSRFRNRKEQKEILQGVRDGRVDIVIGTHRLLQKDVAFQSLGLLVIDEEQRFGVKHKEVLKKKRSTVDVLALSATPIPRTLHMSLTGMRDISVISTPPADRQPIISYISKFEESVIKDAVRREISRDGQVFFVHNNIRTIFKMAETLGELVPEAKIGVAHGRLSETELENVMLKFVNFEIDVLVCTTIIESGLDIPSANTMIINKAERFGLSQIYQLRGRIGRGDHQAYAYLFISDEDRLTKDARKRLAALMEHRDLGSGFQIAMKDLQIRGAGTALGASQSGHIAAVGYDLFLKLLDHAVKDLKGNSVREPLEPEINAAMSSGFSDDYIESVEQRLTLYRRLSRLTRISEITDMKRELMDRYGKLPKSAENMLLKIMLRILCINAGVSRLDLSPNTLTLSFSEAHQNRSIEQIVQILGKKVPVVMVKKNSLKIDLGKKRRHIAKALVETRDLLRTIA